MESGEPVDLEEGSNSGEGPHQGEPSEPTPSPSPPAGEETLQVPPRGSGARLGFLLGVHGLSSSRGTQGGGARDGLPPVAAPGSGRKRGRTPVASSSDGDGLVQKKGRNAAGDKQAKKAKSPIGTSCSSQAPSKSVNEISDDEVVEVNAAATVRATRRLTSDVWLEMKKEFVRGEWKGICNYCNKALSASSKSDTSHLRDHLKVCTLRQLKLKSKTRKSLSQSSLRMTAQADGKVNVETYTFDQDTAREELGNMIVLHDYPLSIVDHAGFRRFVGALQPLFHLHTRNTIRKDIIGRHDKEKKRQLST